MSGQLAEAEMEFEKAYKIEPMNSVNRLWYGITLSKIRQYELMAQIAPEHILPVALNRLGRPEEAIMHGHRIIGEGVNPTSYFQALVEDHRFAKLIEVIESHWPSLDDFSGNWPGRSGYGYLSMGFIAHAYRETGNEKMFKDAMHRLKASLDAQLSEGANNWALGWSQAYYFVLAGDHDAAIGFLEESFQQGGYLDTDNETAWPAFKPLDGDPRYEAAKATMNERLEGELQKMQQGSLQGG